MLNTILLVIAGLVPAVVLCSYIFTKDKVEKEPLPLLLKLLLWGALSCMPAAYIERFIIGIINGVFSGQKGTYIFGIVEKCTSPFVLLSS